MFYEAVKNDMANSKETSFNNTISSTLSLITVLFEDLFEAVNIARYPLPLLAGELSDLGMEFLSRNTPSIIADTH